MKDWGWPQYVMAAIYLIYIGMNLAKDGEPEDGHYSFFTAIIASAIMFMILKAGGFF